MGPYILRCRDCSCAPLFRIATDEGRAYVCGDWRHRCAVDGRDGCVPERVYTAHPYSPVPADFPGPVEEGEGPTFAGLAEALLSAPCVRDERDGAALYRAHDVIEALLPYLAQRGVVIVPPF